MTLEVKRKQSWANLGASVAPELIEEIDKFRGEVPRSRVVERACWQFLERESQKKRTLGVGDNNKS